MNDNLMKLSIIVILSTIKLVCYTANQDIIENVKNPKQYNIDPCNSTPIFSWSSVGENISYIFSIATDENCQNTLANFHDIVISDTTYTITESLPAGSYYWCIASIYTYTTNNKQLISDAVSSPFSIKTLSPPINLSVDNNPDNDGNIVYKWDNNGQIAHSIQIMLNNDVSYAVSDSSSIYDAWSNFKSSLTAGRYTWRVKIKNENCESLWSETSTFTVNSTCQPPIWELIPNHCYNNGGNVQFSIKNGPPNVKYNFQFKNKHSDWGIIQSGWQKDVNYQITPTSNIYGNIEYRVLYDDYPDIESNCEGILTGNTTFDYVIPPSNPMLMVADYVDVSVHYYDENTPNNVQITVSHFDDENSNTAEWLIAIEFEAYYGLLYNLEILFEKTGEIYNWAELTGDKDFTDWECSPGIDIYAGWLPEGWWGWRVKSKAEDGDPTCESDWLDGINDYKGDVNHDICYTQVASVNNWYIFDSAIYLDVDPNNPAQHRIVLSPNNIWKDGDEIECDWAIQNSDSIPLSTCPALVPGSYFNIIVIETRLNENSPCNVEYANKPLGYKKPTGIERVGDNFYECHTLFLGDRNCDGI